MKKLFAILFAVVVLLAAAIPITSASADGGDTPYWEIYNDIVPGEIGAELIHSTDVRVYEAYVIECNGELTEAVMDPPWIGVRWTYEEGDVRIKELGALVSWYDFAEETWSEPEWIIARQPCDLGESPACCGPYYVEIVEDVQVQWYGEGKWRVISTDMNVLLRNPFNGDIVEPTYVNEGGSFGDFVVFDDLSWESSFYLRIVMNDEEYTPVWSFFGHLTKQRTTCSSWPYYAFNADGAWYLEGMVPSDMMLNAEAAWDLTRAEAIAWSETLDLGWNARP